MDRDAAYAALSTLVAEGWLLGVGVFGDDCCLHGIEECESDGYGLCDNANKHSPAGSDCNRAQRFLMRPHDDLMTEAIASEIAETWEY